MTIGLGLELSLWSPYSFWAVSSWAYLFYKLSSICTLIPYKQQQMAMYNIQTFKFILGKYSHLNQKSQKSYCYQSEYVWCGRLFQTPQASKLTDLKICCEINLHFQPLPIFNPLSIIEACITILSRRQLWLRQHRRFTCQPGRHYTHTEISDWFLINWIIVMKSGRNFESVLSRTLFSIRGWLVFEAFMMMYWV